MDLDVVGRHALLFDDDAMAIFVNSADALVEWNSLYIDRYDVRHLLSAPLPQPKRSLHSLSHAIDSSLKSELDLERYLDLPPSDPEKDEESTAHLVYNTGGYHAIPFSYGNANGNAEERNQEMGVETSAFRPPFNVPEHLLQCLPPSEKVHQIIARTAQFVSRHGGQSEIVLRVKQGDNPTFGFLMPDHHLHPYYRFLVDHQELLHIDGDGKPQHEENKAVGEPDGALSLLGSVYGSGEDDDVLIEDVSNNMTSNEAVDAAPIAQEKDESSESSATVPRQEIGLQHPLNSCGLDKEKSHLLKEKPSISGSKNGSTRHKKVKDDSISASIQAALEKLKASGLGVIVKTEPVVLEPPSDLKKLIEKIVEFILKNGKQFEATLVEQDSKHGRFPFLLPSNMYHPYYLKVLHGRQESKVSGKSLPSGSDNSIGRPPEKRASLSKGDSALACGSGDGDLPCENDKKEKFKMVIGKSRKEPQEQLDKVPQQENGFNLDAASVAAILQAAARGIKNPNIGIFSKTDVNAKSNAEANSSESQLTKEQMLKAERRKKAKMFVAMLKNKAPPLKSEPSREVPLEPQDSGELNDNKSDQDGRLKFIDEQNEKRSMRKYRSRSGIDEEDEDGSERNHQSAGTDHKSLRTPMDDEKGEESEDGKDHKRSKRKKHHQSHQSNEDEASDVYEDERRGHRHSSKKHRSHIKYDDDDDDRHSRKKHRSHNKHDDDDDDDDGHSRKKHRSQIKHDDYDDDDVDDRHSRKKHRHHNKHDEDDDGEGKYHRHSRKRHRSHHSSHHRSRHERSKRGSSTAEGEDLEEGEISGGGKVSDQSKGSLEGGAISSREDSIGVTCPQQLSASQPPDDLKAKIRAMLMETRR